MKQGQVNTQLIKSNVEDEEEDKLGYVYLQNLPGLEWSACLLINSESSVAIFNNADLLTKIHQVKKPLQLHCNAGNIQVTEKGWFGEIEVWCHLKGITNILSLKTLKNRHRDIQQQR